MRAIKPTMPPATPPIMAGRLVLPVLLDPFESAVGVDTSSDVATMTLPLGSVDVKVWVRVTGARKLVAEDDEVVGVGVGVVPSGLAVVVTITVLSGRVLGGGVLLSHDEPNSVWVGFVTVLTVVTVMGMSDRKSVV